MTVAARRVATREDTPRSVVMLHGIYGRGRNWQAVAQGVVAARPEYACWLVDLPHHGDSGPGAHGDTVRGLAQDLSDWLVAAGLTPDAVLGHSYGGKVALAYAMGAPPRPLQVWVIDSTPEAKSPSGSAWHMLAAVRGLPDRFARREDFVEALAGEGFALGVAQWMSTNLVRTGDGFTWRLDFSAMERLLLDFFTTDLWSVVDAPPDHVELHFLKASQSNAMSSGAVKRVAAAAHSWVHLHHREGGHWIHAEAPAVVTALLVKCLPPAIR